MRVNNLIICENALRDTHTDDVSLINILDNIKPVSFPITIGKAAVYAVFIREAESESIVFKGTINISLNDTLLASNDLEFSIPKKRVRVLSRFIGLTIQEPGVLTVQIVIEGHLEQSITVLVSDRNISVNEKD